MQPFLLSLTLTPKRFGAGSPPQRRKSRQHSHNTHDSLPRAAEVIREAIYRGADSGIVLTDRALGGADTLATSYSLAQAVKKIGNYDIILGGRQAIDGDTAQVGTDSRKARTPAGDLC